jgi:hypothetical protein
MSAEDDRLLTGAHSLGAERTIDLETLLAVTHVVGHLGMIAKWGMPTELVDSLSGVLQGGTFHPAEFEFRIKGETATIDEKRDELERCLTALRNQLRSINRQAD